MQTGAVQIVFHTGIRERIHDGRYPAYELADMNKPISSMAFALLFCLGGCGKSGLTSEEIEKAFRSMAPFNERTSPAFHDFKVRRCDAVTDDKVFNCEFQFMQMGRTEVAKAQFSRSRDGWAMVDFASIASYNDSK
ncbi:hypothetical protein MKK69_14360 [Methylobacterium sp. J-026]|uniref:hypothetical protein n=1 Tax=Methylobacterium sp. J-026 TaxID=2836624 RepID=UPI001FBBE041|nr:hypothetical protein [Methylobacterium sp. J-026]MCJ2135221.1 hypothetical protein [Methylobacterium sp. J-026]